MAMTCTREAALGAVEVVQDLLGNTISRMEVVGAVRRGRQQVPGLDLLVYTEQRVKLIGRLADAGFEEKLHASLVTREKVRFTLNSEAGVSVTLHLVESMDGWPGMMILTTGGERTIKRLEREASNARRYVDWSASTISWEGRRGTRRQRYLSERGMFLAILGRYIKPEARE